MSGRVGRCGLEERPTATPQGGTADEKPSGTIIKDLKDPSEVVADPQSAGDQKTVEQGSSTAKQGGREGDSVTELASVLLRATTKPIQALEREWSDQLGALQSGIEERFDAVEQIITNVTQLEEAIEGVRAEYRDAEKQAELAENQSKDCVEQIGSLRTVVSGKLQEVTDSIERIRNDMTAQETVLHELRHAEERRAEAVERLATIFGGAQDAVSLLGTTVKSVSTEPQSG